MRSIIIVIAALLFVRPCYAQGAAQDSDGVPGNGTTVNLKPTSSGYEADIFLPAGKYTAANAISSDPTISKFLTQRVETRDEPIPPPPRSSDDPEKKSAPAATSQSQPPKTAGFARVVTVVLNSGAIPQSQYRFTLKLTGATSLTRDLLLSVPASQVDAIDTLVVLSEWGKLDWFGEATTANQPQIWETSQKKWLTHVTLDQKGQTDAGTDPAGRIKPKRANLDDVVPGKNELILLGRDYDLDGPFPLGTAKGKLALNADQLTNPVTFNFEVRSRIWVAWLFAPMFVGLVLGYTARHWLADFLSLSQQKRKCYDLITLIDQALLDNKDSAFQDAIKAIRKHALAAAAKKTPENIKADLEKPQTDFQNATAELQKRRNELAQKIGVLGGIAQATYEVPAAITQALQGARKEIDTNIAVNLAFNDVATAKAAFDDSYKTVRTAAIEAGNGWIKAASQLDLVIELLEPAFGPNGADLSAELKAIVNPVGAAVVEFHKDTTGAVAPLTTMLGTLHSSVCALGQFRDQLASRVRNRLEHLTLMLDPHWLPQPTLWTDWLRDSKAFAATVEKLVPRDPKAEPLKDEGQKLATQLDGALRNQTKDQAFQKELDELLNQKKVVDAVTRLATALRPKQAIETMLASAEEGATVPYDIRIMGAAAPMVYASYAISAEPDSAAIALLQARTEREIETAGWLQTLIFGAVIVGAGYFLFADKWVGTPIDFAAVLFWAFATDIGADAATTTAKNFNKHG